MWVVLDYSVFIYFTIILCSMQYEDFVPPQVETALGGFYINTGQLDFKCRTDLDPE